MSDEEFEKTDSGASLTVPVQFGDLKKGEYALLKGKPCRVVEITTAKTGKHGHAKASVTGIDIFTGNKVEDGGPTSHNTEKPIVKRTEYTLIEITDDNFTHLMEENGDVREDIKLPPGEDDQEMVSKIKDQFSAGKDLTICVIGAMNQEKIVSFRESNN